MGKFYKAQSEFCFHSGFVNISMNCSAIVSFEINFLIFLLCFSLLKIKEPQFFDCLLIYDIFTRF